MTFLLAQVTFMLARVTFKLAQMIAYIGIDVCNRQSPSV